MNNVQPFVFIFSHPYPATGGEYYISRLVQHLFERGYNVAQINSKPNLKVYLSYLLPQVLSKRESSVKPLIIFESNNVRSITFSFLCHLFGVKIICIHQETHWRRKFRIPSKLFYLALVKASFLISDYIIVNSLKTYFDGKSKFCSIINPGCDRYGPRSTLISIHKAATYIPINDNTRWLLYVAPPTVYKGFNLIKHISQSHKLKESSIGLITTNLATNRALLNEDCLIPLKHIADIGNAFETSTCLFTASPAEAYGMAIAEYLYYTNKPVFAPNSTTLELQEYCFLYDYDHAQNKPDIIIEFIIHNIDALRPIIQNKNLATWNDSMHECEKHILNITS